MGVHGHHHLGGQGFGVNNSKGHKSNVCGGAPPKEMRGSDLQHHPKSFLIKFEHRRRHAEALKKGFPSAVGLSFILFKWHKSVLSIALMFCVHLYLDGVPHHA
ncbi:Os07g0182501 [Oryza sativa Japonica Group]|uniref:Os07g0182501 protein n=1 Tax=Oryza sativa subsp. japonica TaxID=39947 RepID=A0A0P0X2U1_ORYSJ|nr:Os07g0182501 [Oryza sativa Japonica Group]